MFPVYGDVVGNQQNDSNLFQQRNYAEGYSSNLYRLYNSGWQVGTGNFIAWLSSLLSLVELTTLITRLAVTPCFDSELLDYRSPNLHYFWASFGLKNIIMISYLNYGSRKTVPPNIRTVRVRLSIGVWSEIVYPRLKCRWWFLATQMKKHYTVPNEVRDGLPRKVIPKSAWTLRK